MYKINISNMDGGDIATLTCVIILLCALVVVSFFLILIYIKKKRSRRTKLVGTIETETTISNYNEHLQQKLQKEIKQYKEKISKLSKINDQDVEKELKDVINNELDTYRAEQITIMQNELRNFKAELGKEILIQSMQSIVVETTSDFSTYTIAISNDLKSRIIGKKGRNMKKFEQETGCELVVEKEPNITISCLNPMRKEIGIRVMQHLIKSNAFDEMAIEIITNKEKAAFNDNLKTIGESALIELKINDVNPVIYQYLGRLKYRISYGQNILAHCMESARLAEKIAILINADPIKAKKAGLFHDIGKANDYETKNDHIAQGILIAKEANLESDVIDAIKDHHSPIATNIYSAITKIADTISASRPGARLINYEDAMERTQEIENICKKYDQVIDAYALKSGRNLRVIINNDITDQKQLELLCYKIKKDLETNDKTNKFDINIVFCQIKTLNLITEKKN